jgi:hypothetical protein
MLLERGERDDVERFFMRRFEYDLRRATCTIGFEPA